MSALRTAARARAAAAISSLRVRNYRLYFVGQSVSVAGSFMQTLAIAFLTLQLTGSGAQLGIVIGTRLVPFVLLGPLGASSPTATTSAGCCSSPRPRPRAPGQVREGLRCAVRTPDPAVPLLMLTVTGIVAYDFPTTLPLLATDTFYGDAVTYGVMAAAMAGGAVVGGVPTVLLGLVMLPFLGRQRAR